MATLEQASTLTLERTAPDFAKHVAAVILAEIAEINGVAGMRSRGGNVQRSANGMPITRGPMNPVDALRATALSKLGSFIESRPTSDPRIYPLARRQAFVHGDLSEWTPTDKERDTIARYGAGPHSDPGAFLEGLADAAWREIISFATDEIADLKEQLAASDDERVTKLRDELKVQTRANKALTGRLKRAEAIVARVAEADEIKARAAELQAEREQLLEQLDETTNELAAQLKEAA